MIRRDIELSASRSPRAGTHRFEFVVLLHVGIIKVAENPELIVTELVLESGITAPALLFRIRAGERVKVKAGKQPERSANRSWAVDPVACRSQSVRKIRRCAEDDWPRRGEVGSACLFDHVRAQLKIVRRGIWAPVRMRRTEPHVIGIASVAIEH